MENRLAQKIGRPELQASGLDLRTGGAGDENRRGIDSLLDHDLEQPQPIGLDEKCRVRAVEPRQVGDVDRLRDEERRFDQRTHALDASGHVRPARNSSASR